MICLWLIGPLILGISILLPSKPLITVKPTVTSRIAFEEEPCARETQDGAFVCPVTVMTTITREGNEVKSDLQRVGFGLIFAIAIATVLLLPKNRSREPWIPERPVRDDLGQGP
jgi:hypothetical protein